MNIDTNDAPVTVEQRDRDFAYCWMIPDHVIAEGVKAGQWDSHHAVQAAARHRLAALASAPAGDGRMLPCPNPWCDSDSPPFMHRVVSHREEWAVSCGCGFLGPILDNTARAEAAWNSRRAAVAPAGDGVEDREVGRMRELARDWRRPNLAQIEGPGDLKIFGGSIADDIDRWADMLAAALARPRASLEGQPA